MPRDQLVVMAIDDAGDLEDLDDQVDAGDLVDQEDDVEQLLHDELEPWPEEGPRPQLVSIYYEPGPRLWDTRTGGKGATMSPSYLPGFDPRDGEELAKQGASLSADQRALLWSLAKQLETADVRVYLTAGDSLALSIGGVEVLVLGQVLDASSARAIAGGSWPGAEVADDGR